MNTYRPVILALALLGALAPSLDAQERTIVFEPARRGWLGFSFERTEVRRPGESTLTLNVVSVVDDSPAAKAGLQKGDAILRINGLGASEDLLGSLGSSLNPGDTVTFHIRRAGTERDLRIVAAKPPQDFAARFTVRIEPDSVRKLVRIYTDSMRSGMDTTVFKYLQRGDSAFARTYVWRDSVRPGMDSTWVRMFRGRVPLDSVRGFAFDMGMRFDSVVGRRPFSVRGDSTMFFGPGEDRVFAYGFSGGDELMVRPYTLGMRAVGGAELHELNPELARYFRVEEGVLVMNAAQGTPARRAGLQPGDVITAVDGAAVTRILQLRRAIERANAKTVELEVVRDGQKRTVELPR